MRQVTALQELYVHNIDLHYHAGQERQPDTTLEGYLGHAVMTGRRILGLTDHLEKYIGDPLSSAATPALYEQSVEGLQSYRADMDSLRDQFPSLQLFLGPEIHAGPRIDIQHIPQGIVDVSDYFLVALPNVESSIGDNTATRVARIHAIAEMRERTGKPVFVAHPFRAAVDARLVKRPIAPWITRLAPRTPREFTDDQVSTFFGFDVRALGQVCREHAVPVEVNGGTDSRIRGLNLPAPLQMYWASYSILKEEGVTFVPGSDQHGYMRTPVRREGRYVPFDTFEILGLTAKDIVFVTQLLSKDDMPCRAPAV